MFWSKSNAQQSPLQWHDSNAVQGDADVPGGETANWARIPFFPLPCRFTDWAVYAKLSPCWLIAIMNPYEIIHLTLCSGMAVAANFLVAIAVDAKSETAIPQNSAAHLNHPWEMIEMTFEARGDQANPYMDGLPEGKEPTARATFIGASGPAQGMRHTVTLFWDGAKTWKARFAPPAAGEWTWSTASKDPGLDGANGILQVVDWTETEKQANPTRRGFIRVHQGSQRAGRYFEYADGTPFLWIGDTWWNWTKRGIQFSSFQRLADDRAAKGFTVGQLFFSPNGLLNRNFDTPNLEQIRKVEQMIAYANSKGITLWIHPWWSRERLNERVSVDQMRRWWRYVIARLGAYNTLWVLAGEYNMNNYGGFGLPFWQDLGAMVKSEDPHRRIVGVHPTPPGWSGGADAPQWSTGEVIHAEPWLDYNQSQVGHGRWRNEMIPRVVAADYAREPAKPTVVTEPWYEFIEGNPTGMEVRYGAWSAVLSGAAGHSYGGGHVWWAHLPESPASQGSWPLETSFATNTLDYPGARSMSYLARFLGAIPWWTLEPHPELVSDYAAPLCAAVPGHRYVVYLRYGGAIKVDLRPSQTTDQFEYAWTDLEQSQGRTRGKVNGGAVRAFHAPEDYPGNLRFKDWLLNIRRVEP